MKLDVLKLNVLKLDVLRLGVSKLGISKLSGRAVSLWTEARWNRKAYFGTMRLVRFLLGALLAFALLSLLVYLFGATRLQVQGSSLDGGSLTFETQLPNATCRKEVTAEFPFVRLECN